jgi:hypothetical protein
MAAGEFIMARLKNYSSTLTSSSMVHSAEREASDLLTGIVRVHAKNKSGGEVASLVDALLESATVLREWQTIAELLLSKKRKWVHRVSLPVVTGYGRFS